jgi:hypothetical protein
MYRFFLSIVIATVFYSCASGQSISVVTYNVRYGLVDDGENSWQYRKEFLVWQLQFHSTDIFDIPESDLISDDLPALVELTLEKKF